MSGRTTEDGSCLASAVSFASSSTIHHNTMSVDSAAIVDGVGNGNGNGGSGGDASLCTNPVPSISSSTAGGGLPLPPMTATLALTHGAKRTTSYWSTASSQSTGVVTGGGQVATHEPN